MCMCVWGGGGGGEGGLDDSVLGRKVIFTPELAKLAGKI